MRLIQIVRGLAAIVVVTGGLAFATAGTAEARPYVADLFIDGDMAAWTSFESDGEHFTACDRDKDGFSAAVVWKVPGSSGQQVVWATGKGKCKGFNDSITDGVRIKFKACIGHSYQAGFAKCSPWEGAVA